MKKNIKLILGTLGVASIILACNTPAQVQSKDDVAVTEIATDSSPMEISAEAVDSALGADITFKTYEANFGTIKQGDSFEYDFEFTNTGTTDLLITNARGSCGCTVPEWPHEPIPAGATGKVHVKFNSAGKSQQQTKTVTLETNASPTPVILYIKGFVETGQH
jgi:hypothetical protein